MMENGEWRIRYNEEINQIIKGRDIVKFIKSLRLQRKGRPRTRWMDDVMEDIRIMKIRGWREKINYRRLESDREGGQGSHRALAPYSK
ncbi:hypothetical protein C0J52_12946 [Blattella germanica]|nr:hypothetical protein C0J52_12946 [Blattella germanica]